jgi:hypothetical protein
MFEYGTALATPSAGLAIISFEIAIVRREQEVTYSAPDLIVWTPEDGERELWKRSITALSGPNALPRGTDLPYAGAVSADALASYLESPKNIHI